MVWGRNDWVRWGETTRVENRGETTRGKRPGVKRLGAKRLVTLRPIQSKKRDPSRALQLQLYLHARVLFF